MLFSVWQISSSLLILSTYFKLVSTTVKGELRRRENLGSILLQEVFLHPYFLSFETWLDISLIIFNITLMYKVNVEMNTFLKF